MAAAVAQPADADGVHRASASLPRVDARRTGRRISRSTPGCTASARPADALAAVASAIADERHAPRRLLDAPRGGRRARQGRPPPRSSCAASRTRARDRWPPPGCVPDLVHAANSAGAIAHPAARFDLVRCGIAMYGVAPSPRWPAASTCARRCRCGPRSPTCAGSRRGRACPTATASSRSRRHDDRDGPARLRRRRSPAAGRRRRAGAGRRAPPAHRRCRDDGSADGRLRPRRRRGRRRRGGADRPPGRRGDHRRRVGGPARHDRVRDRLRHRAPRATSLLVVR